MIEKKADNEENLQNKLKQIDSSIENMENQEKNLNVIKDSFLEINELSNNMLELFFKSIKGKGINNQFDEISYQSFKRTNNLVEEFDKDFQKMKQDIDELYAKKDIIQKELNKRQDDNNK